MDSSEKRYIKIESKYRTLTFRTFKTIFWLLPVTVEVETFNKSKRNAGKSELDVFFKISQDVVSEWQVQIKLQCEVNR